MIATKVKRAIRQLGDLASVTDFLNHSGNRAELLGQTVRTRAIIKDGLEVAEEDPENRAELEKVLDAGRGALLKIAAQGESVNLSALEQTAVQAVMHLVARPAILVQKDRFATPPERWAKPLRQEETAIWANLPLVGAIERTQAGKTELVGTGFLCGPGMVMTNRHVLATIARPQSGTWKFAAEYQSRLDFAREKDIKITRRFGLTAAIGAHPDPKIDLALLGVSAKSSTGDPLPQPLRISKAKPDFGEPRQVYVLGYPLADKSKTAPDALARIFAGIYSVKRLQPGLILHVDEAAKDLGHDCSTLGGNSGSPVIDLRTGQVVGLHCFGTYLKSNRAVALWTLADDPFLKKQKVEFV